MTNLENSQLNNNGPGVDNFAFSGQKNDSDQPQNQQQQKPHVAQRHSEYVNLKTLQDKFVYKPVQSHDILKSTYRYAKKYYKPSPSCMISFLYARVPFLLWIRNYDMKENFVKDLAGGITIGVIQIPQGMAYALQAGVPAINGIYVTFFQMLIYLFTGTSRHISVGTFAIISLLTFSAINKYDGDLFGPLSSPPKPTYIDIDPVKAKVKITMVLCFGAGILHVIFGILHVGVVTKFLSDNIVFGFTCGAAYQIVVSLIPNLLGINIPIIKSPFVLIATIVEIIKQITHTNYATLIISFITILFLYLAKTQINDRFKDKLPVPIPIDLMVVILGTLIVYLAKLNTRYGVAIVGNMPVGFPKPELPPFELLPKLISDIISIGIVSFAINIAMAKLFAKKYNYDINANQELLSYGTASIVASFFLGFPGSVALSRCVILDGIGAKTQIYSFYASFVLLLVILFIGPYFETLPKACLSGIIVAALRLLMQEVLKLPKLYKRSKLDALAWFVTFLGVVILNVDMGLYIGLVASIMLVILRSQRAGASVIGNIPGTNIYESIDACDDVQEFTNIKIIRYEESVYYANVENFKYQIMKLVGINPFETLTVMKKKQKRATKTESGFVKKIKKKLFKKETFADSTFKGEETATDNNNIKIFFPEFEIKHVIIDCSCINFVDSQGIHEIFQLTEAYKEIGIQLHMTYMKLTILRKFKLDLNHTKLDYNFMYPSTVDAVHHILKSIQVEEDFQNSNHHTPHRPAHISFNTHEVYYDNHIDKPTDKVEHMYNIEKEDLDNYSDSDSVKSVSQRIDDAANHDDITDYVTKTHF